jgi:TonB family protein
MKSILFLTSILFYCTQTLVAQGTDAATVAAVPGTGIREPQPKGGMKALHAFIEDNLRYPDHSFDHAIEGTVYVRFTVSKTGRVTTAEIDKGVAPELDQEALRLIALSDQELGWLPGSHQGKNVEMLRIVPVTFAIEIIMLEMPATSDH